MINGLKDLLRWSGVMFGDGLPVFLWGLFLMHKRSVKCDGAKKSLI
jgi:hypothetical protein